MADRVIRKRLKVRYGPEKNRHWSTWPCANFGPDQTEVRQTMSLKNYTFFSAKRQITNKNITS